MVTLGGGPTVELSCEPLGVGLVQALLVALTAEQAECFYVVLAHVDPFFGRHSELALGRLTACERSTNGALRPCYRPS